MRTFTATVTTERDAKENASAETRSKTSRNLKPGSCRLENTGLLKEVDYLESATGVTSAGR